MPETIFMIHGMNAGPWVWDGYARAFAARGHTCIAATLRYHDADPKDAPDPRLGTTSLLDYAGDLEDEIRGLGVSPVVMGHSLGGLLAQMLASRGLARSLVLLTPAAPAGINAIRLSVIRSFWSVLPQWGFWKKPVRPTFEDAHYAMLHKLPPALQKATYDRFVYESGRVAAEMGFWLFDPWRASRVDAARVHCPVLVLAGADDRITPPSVVRKVARKYKRTSTYRELPGRGHWLVGEPGWETIAEQIADWLDD